MAQQVQAGGHNLHGLGACAYSSTARQYSRCTQRRKLTDLGMQVVCDAAVCMFSHLAEDVTLRLNRDSVDCEV